LFGDRFAKGDPFVCLLDNPGKAMVREDLVERYLILVRIALANRHPFTLCAPAERAAERL
jgi:hypothetical protein